MGKARSHSHATRRRHVDHGQIGDSRWEAELNRPVQSIPQDSGHNSHEAKIYIYIYIHMGPVQQLIAVKELRAARSQMAPDHRFKHVEAVFLQERTACLSWSKQIKKEADLPTLTPSQECPIDCEFSSWGDWSSCEPYCKGWGSNGSCRQPWSSPTSTVPSTVMCHLNSFFQVLAGVWLNEFE